MLCSTWRLLRVSALSPRFAAGRPGEADSSGVNCFYHKNKCFLSSLSSQDESTDRNHATPHAALVGHAAGRSPSPKEMEWEGQGRPMGAWSSHCLCLKNGMPMGMPKKITPWGSPEACSSAPGCLPQSVTARAATCMVPARPRVRLGARLTPPPKVGDAEGGRRATGRSGEAGGTQPA